MANLDSDNLHIDKKYVSYIFLRPPSFLAVQGVGMLKLSSGLIRAAKFTKNTNDQWNHAGGFATTISTSLSFEDVNSKRLTDLWCPVRGLRTPQMPTAARQWHSEG